MMLVRRLSRRAIAAITLSLGLASSAWAADEIVLKFADTHPLTHFLSVNGHQFFMRKVEQLTSGKVKFQHFPAEQLGKEKDMLELARKGISDIVFTGAGQSSGKLPLGGGADLPGLGADVVKNTRAYQILLSSNTLVVDEFVRFGLRPVMGFMYPPYQILTGSKPVRTIAELQGLKIRINSPIMGSAIEALGGTPVMLTASEVFEGLQRGTVDGTTFSYISGKSWKLDGVIKYGTVGIDVGTVGSFWAINENAWKRLPEDVKKAIRQAADETSANVAALADKEEKSIEAEWEQKGKSLHRLTPAEQAEWGKKVRPAIEQWITAMEARGLPARKSVEQLWKIRAELK